MAASESQTFSTTLTDAIMADGRVIFPDSQEIIERLRESNAVLLVIDPFNHAHHFEDGNNNVMIAKAAGEISRVARESDAAVMVLPHLRKGASGSPDDLMGATSLRATFRTCWILARMTPEAADSYRSETRGDTSA